MIFLRLLIIPHLMSFYFKRLGFLLSFIFHFRVSEASVSTAPIGVGVAFSLWYHLA